VLAVATAVVLIEGTGLTTTGSAIAEPQQPDSVLELMSIGASGEAIVGAAPSISEDGRFVVFDGAADDGSDRQTVWLRDNELDTVREVTAPPPGLRAGDSRSGVVSADGCTVTVLTEQSYDVFRDDDRGLRWDVYQLTLSQCGGDAGNWQLVSTSDLDGAAVALDGIDPSVPPAVSATGATVVFAVPVFAGLTQLMVADLTVPTGAPGRVSAVPGLPEGPPSGAGRYIGQRQPAVSGDGRVIAFASDSNADAGADGDGSEPDWVGAPADQQAPTSVYTWLRTAQYPRALLAGASLGQEPSLSDDGRYVVFAATSAAVLDSTSEPECPDRGCALPQVVWVDRDTDDNAIFDETGHVATRLVSSTGGRPGNGMSWAPSVDADGRYVAFLTRATNLVKVSPSTVADARAGDVVLSDIVAGVVQRVSVRPDGVTPSDVGGVAPKLAGSGRALVFETSVARQLLGRPGLTGSHVVMFKQQPVPTLAPLDLGTTGVGYDSFEWFTTLRNPGPTTFVPAQIQSSNGVFRVTGGSCSPGVPVPPGASCTVHVVARPDADGSVEGELVVAEDGFDAQVVNTQLTAQGGIPYLASEPAGIDFGEAVVGASLESRLIQVSNLGYGDLELVGAGVSGLHPGDFTVEEDSCRGVSLRAGATCIVRVGFSPHGSGPRSAIVSVAARNGDRVSTVLSAAGRYTPLIDATPKVARPGQVITVSGIGFPAGEPVVVTWSVAGSAVTTVADDNGVIVASMVLGKNQAVGLRTMVAVDPSRRYEAVSTEKILVVAAPRRLPPAVLIA
jgi:hypothetical protein